MLPLFRGTKHDATTHKALTYTHRFCMSLSSSVNSTGGFMFLYLNTVAPSQSPTLSVFPASTRMHRCSLNLIRPSSSSDTRWEGLRESISHTDVVNSFLRDEVWVTDVWGGGGGGLKEVRCHHSLLRRGFNSTVSNVALSVQLAILRVVLWSFAVGCVRFVRVFLFIMCGRGAVLRVYVHRCARLCASPLMVPRQH